MAAEKPRFEIVPSWMSPWPGMNLQGGVARCYDWYMDYLKCLDESKAPMIKMRELECKEWLDDFEECRHHMKERLRQNLIKREAHRQELAQQQTHKAH